MVKEYEINEGDTLRQITIYPKEDLLKRIRAIALSEKRSINSEICLTLEKKYGEGPIKKRKLVRKRFEE